MLKWVNENNGTFTLYKDTIPILTAYAHASDALGRSVITRESELISEKTNGGDIKLVFEGDSGLVLTEYLSIKNSGAYAHCILSSADGKAVETNDLVPLVMWAKSDESPYIWRSLQGKMLQVPYDNDMWPRYEAVSFLPGRKSSDMTVLFSEETREGILIGATDFDIWKNAIACPGFDCRTLEARSGAGACDESTHDRRQHASIIGKEVSSSRFVILYGEDYRDLLEQYGDLISQKHRIRSWNEGIPFGYNTYAALGIDLDEEKYRHCGTFMRENLMPKGFKNRGTTYINLDGGWREMDRDAMLLVKDEYLAAGQRIGIYDSPFAYWGVDLDAEIPYLDEPHTFREIILKNEAGEPIPPLDTAYPYDVTHPVWKEWTRRKAQFYIDWGFSYLKVDFMSHAGIEACHYDPSVRTGRQAINEGYSFFSSLYSQEKTGRPFFISLSISPLFPCGYGNSRRFSCDAFGLSEDIEYALNAQTWCWWHAGRLYQYNDSDHVVLHKAFTMLQESTESEARARYTTAAIAGGVMLLSDDFKDKISAERALKIATNRAVNAVAASGVAFRPVESAGGSAGHIYTGVIDGQTYAAIFNWSNKPAVIEVSCERAGLCEGVYTDLWTEKKVNAINGSITWEFESTDAALLKLE